MFSLMRKFFLVMALLTLIPALFCWKFQSPWFWIFLGVAGSLTVMGMGLKWMVRILVFYGVFYAVKLFFFSSILAFIAASLVSALVSRQFRSKRAFKDFVYH